MLYSRVFPEHPEIPLQLFLLVLHTNIILFLTEVANLQVFSFVQLQRTPCPAAQSDQQLHWHWVCKVFQILVYGKKQTEFTRALGDNLSNPTKLEVLFPLALSRKRVYFESVSYTAICTCTLQSQETWPTLALSPAIW